VHWCAGLTCTPPVLCLAPQNLPAIARVLPRRKLLVIGQHKLRPVLPAACGLGRRLLAWCRECRATVQVSAAAAPATPAHRCLVTHSVTRAVLRVAPQRMTKHCRRRPECVCCCCSASLKVMGQRYYTASWGGDAALIERFPLEVLSAE
jgi:hypothetical protein